MDHDHVGSEIIDTDCGARNRRTKDIICRVVAHLPYRAQRVACHMVRCLWRGFREA